MKQQLLTPSLAIGTLAAAFLVQVGFAPTAFATSLTASHTAVAGYHFDNGSGTAASLVPTGASLMNFLYVGSDINAGLSNGRSGAGFSAMGFSEDNAIDVNSQPVGIPDGFFEITVAPNQAGSIIFNGICFDILRNSSNSPTSMLLRSSFDNYQNNLFDPIALSGNNWQYFYSPFNAITTASAITFRLYFLGGGGSLNIDQVYLKGGIAPPQTVPTPALLPALTGFGLAALRKRKRATAPAA
jgi:hypothetical protein